MRYKLIGSNDTSNIIKTTLENRGIANWNEYINLNSINDEAYKNLDNINVAVECFSKHIDNNDQIAILSDTDPDGICSATIMYKYIKSMNPDAIVHMLVHKKPKAHGLSSKDFEIPKEVKLLIIPDSSTNDIDECQEFINSGMSVIIVDHHIKSDDRENPAILINNQTSPHYDNKEACGAHITYDFICAIDDYYWTDYHYDFVDLVALADVSDVMSMRSFPTRAAVNYGFNSLKNKMFKQIIEAQDFSMKGIVSPHTVAFYVTPLINSFLRMATYEERELLVRAFCEDESETFWYTKRGEDFPTEENIYEHCVRLMRSYKSKQDRQKLKALPQLIKMAGSTEDKVAIINATGILDSALTGVVAIKVSETLNVPVILLQQQNEENYGGSARAFDNCPIEDFRSLIDSCPYTTFAQGHPSACGVSIPTNNIANTKQWLNEQLADISMEKVYQVDFILDASELDPYMFQQLDHCKTTWGHGVDEPLFAIQNIKISSDNSKVVGSKHDTIQIYDDETEVKYVMFLCKENNELLQWIDNNWGDEETTITVIGTLEVNSYKGELTSQVKIKDFDLTVQN